MKMRFSIKIIITLLITVLLTVVLISILSNYYIRQNFSVFCQHYGNELPQCLRDSAGQTFLESIQQSFVVAGLIGILFSFLIGILITKILLKPIKEIIRVSSEFASGKYSERIKIHTSDEFEDLIKVENDLFETVESQDILRKELIANFSHEISTPLTNIYGYIQALQDGIIDKKESKKVLTILKRETERLIKLSKEVKSLALLESNSVEYNLQNTNIRNLIEDVLEVFKQQIEKKGISIKIIEEQPKIELMLDKDKIIQAIYNILDNAIKYSPNNSSIKIYINLDSEFVSIEIKDNGIGISKKDIRKVFERFYKVQNKKDNNGTGIGLTITKRILEGHGGEIDIKSSVGRGTTVIMRIPNNK